MTAIVEDTLSRPIRDLRISVTDRCNFRCPYCMPAEIYGERYQFLDKSQTLTFDEITRLTRIFVQLGAKKIRLTGGEPLVRAELDKLVALLCSIKGIQDLTLTTNGYLLAQQAQALADAGLQRITVSLDSLDGDIFRRMNGVGHGPDRVLEGIDKAVRVGLNPVKINTVVQRGVNDHTIIDLARRFKGTNQVLRFIEFMDVGNRNGWSTTQVVSAKDIVARIHAELPLEPVQPNYTGEVAQRYRYIDGGGEIGVIASVTQPFCGDCTRIRLSADGSMYTCLFASAGLDLKQSLRSGAGDQDLAQIIIDRWMIRDDRYSELRASLTDGGRNRRKIEMYQIGG
jgi:cyclic pyranopterin phosphate synthase